MFLRSSSILSVSYSNNVSFEYKRCGLMRESCIKGSLCHSSSADSDSDNAYLIGGNNGFGSTRNAQCFNLEKNKWTLIKSTLFEHDDYPCLWTELSNDSMYYGMIGCMGHSQQLGCVEYYDRKSDTWIAHCQFPDFSAENKMHISRMIPVTL